MVIIITTKLSPNYVPLIYKLATFSDFVKSYALCFRIPIQDCLKNDLFVHILTRYRLASD